MKEMNASSTPYKVLGSELKKMRISRQETIAEVAGAVEIDVEALSAYEAGIHRPSEDILLLLISHFALKEDQATKLWDLASYDKTKLPDQHMSNSQAGGATAPTVMVMPLDARIAYTDMVHVVANNYGVIMNFMQSGGPNDKPLTVSRIGMSKDHARSVLDVLEKTLNQQQKQLPANKKKKD